MVLWKLSRFINVRMRRSRSGEQCIWGDWRRSIRLAHNAGTETTRQTLSPRRVEWLNRLARHTGGGGSLFGAEGISGVALNELDPPTARRVGQAFGLCIAKAAAATSPEARDRNWLAMGDLGRPNYWRLRRKACNQAAAGSSMPARPTAPALLLGLPRTRCGRGASRGKRQRRSAASRHHYVGTGRSSVFHRRTFGRRAAIVRRAAMLGSDAV